MASNDLIGVIRRNLLWIDSLGGLVVGVLVLATHALLARWHNLPEALILVVGAANLTYGCYSLSLATRTRRPLALIQALAVANLLWAVCCCALVARWWEVIAPLGVLHLGGEGLYVGALGALEWRWRKALSGAPRSR